MFYSSKFSQAQGDGSDVQSSSKLLLFKNNNVSNAVLMNSSVSYELSGWVINTKLSMTPEKWLHKQY